MTAQADLPTDGPKAGASTRARLQRLLEAARAAMREPGAEWRLLAILGAAGLLVVSLFRILGPMLSDFHTFGFHDWDVETAYRYITVVSLKQYHEGLCWHPWLCGGFPAFGDTETASNFLSPYLPLYLLTDLRVAIRLEVVGNALIGLSGAF